MPKYLRTLSFLCCAATASLALARPYPGIYGLAATADVVPRLLYLQPINDRFNASFTFLGTGLSDNLDDWPGRYFTTSYDSLFVSAFPSLALTYTSFEPGFGLSTLYQSSDRTRWGLTYQSKIEPSRDTLLLQIGVNLGSL